MISKTTKNQALLTQFRRWYFTDNHQVKLYEKTLIKNFLVNQY